MTTTIETAGDLKVAGMAVLYETATDLRAGGFRFWIQPGAFNKHLSRQPLDIAMLVGHDSTMPVARTLNGTLALHPVRRGVEFTATLPPTARGRHLFEDVRYGNLDGMSIGMDFKDDDIKWSVRNKETFLEVHTGSFDEISAVLHPAIKGTSIRTLAAGRSTGDTLAQRRLRDYESRIRKEAEAAGRAGPLTLVEARRRLQIAAREPGLTLVEAKRRLDKELDDDLDLRIRIAKARS